MSQVGPIASAANPSAPPPPKRALGVGAVLVSLLLLGAIIGWMVLALHQIDERGANDSMRAVEDATSLFHVLMSRERKMLQGVVRTLIDDARIRSTLATPGIDDATIEDVFRDLQSANGASIIAALNAGGTVRAVIGQPNLRGMDLSSSALFKGLDTRTTTTASAFWTFADRCLLVTVAPLNLSGETAAFLLIATEPSEAALKQIGRTFGLIGGVMIGDKLVAATSKSNEARAALQAATSLPPDQVQWIAGDPPLLALLTRLDALGRSQLVWLAPRHSRQEVFGGIALFAGLPMALMLMAIGTMLYFAMRTR